jgi:hypothetical protein
MGEEKPKASKKFVYTLMFAMLCFGTASTITSKYLDEERAPKIPVSEGCYFFIHPYF